MPSIHEDVARALVEFLNAGLRLDGSPLYTGSLSLGGASQWSAEFAWQPYRSKDELNDLKVLVVPAVEEREAICRGQVAKKSYVQIATRWGCKPTDEARITDLDTLVNDIKDGTELAPMANRAWDSQTNDPLYPRAQLEETGVYLSVVTNVYQHEAS